MKNKKPSLSDVKEYFKDAKTVECLADKKIFEISNLNLVKNNEGGDVYYSFDSENHHSNDDYCVCFTNDKGYAKIITKKEPTYQITKEQILELSKTNCANKEYLNEWFPDVFEVKLKAGKWYKSTYVNKSGINSKFLAFIIDLKSQKNYGFNFLGEWKKNMFFEIPSNSLIEATNQEVETALKNEAVKRYKVGDYIVRNFDKNLGDVIINKEMYINDSEYYYNAQDDYLEFHGFVVYSKGQWALVLETKTIKEAEELLKELGHGCKIVE